MDRHHIQSPANGSVFVAVAALLLGGSLVSGCGGPSRPEPEVSIPVETGAARQAIEHLIRGRLPDSARQCRHHVKSFGMGSSVAWMYFEATREDVLQLLDACPDLSDRSKLGQSPVAQENIEKSVERNQETIPWWHPWELRDRQYGDKTTSFDKLGLFGSQFDVCVGELRNGLCGIYLVCHYDM